MCKQSLNNMQDKTCAKCLTLKKTRFFSKDKQQKDGYRSYCKECCRLLSMFFYYSNKENILPRKRLYSKNNPEKVHRNNLKMYRKFTEKHKARALLNHEVKKGRIIRKPCVICGEVKSEGHHENYKKPLQVTWLCTIHHHQIHRKYA